MQQGAQGMGMGMGMGQKGVLQPQPHRQVAYHQQQQGQPDGRSPPPGLFSSAPPSSSSPPPASSFRSPPLPAHFFSSAPQQQQQQQQQQMQSSSYSSSTNFSMNMSPAALARSMMMNPQQATQFIQTMQQQQQQQQQQGEYSNGSGQMGASMQLQQQSHQYQSSFAGSMSSVYSPSSSSPTAITSSEGDKQTSPPTSFGHTNYSNMYKRDAMLQSTSTSPVVDSSSSSSSPAAPIRGPLLSSPRHQQQSMMSGSQDPVPSDMQGGTSWVQQGSRQMHSHSTQYMQREQQSHIQPSHHRQSSSLSHTVHSRVLQESDNVVSPALSLRSVNESSSPTSASSMSRSHRRSISNISGSLNASAVEFVPAFSNPVSPVGPSPSFQSRALHARGASGTPPTSALGLVSSTASTSSSASSVSPPSSSGSVHRTLDTSVSGVSSSSSNGSLALALSPTSQNRRQDELIASLGLPSQPLDARELDAQIEREKEEHAAYIYNFRTQVCQAYLMNACPYDAYTCFPEEDTRILTNKGFLFLHQIEATLDAVDSKNSAELLYACYDTQKQQIEYVSGELIVKLPHQHAGYVLNFAEKDDRMRWMTNNEQPVPDSAVHHQSHSYSTLRVTPDHDMYVEIGHDDSNGSLDGKPSAMDGEPMIRIPAADLLSTHPNDFIRMLTHARHGIAADADAVNKATTVIHQRLGLDTDAKIGAFLDVYGYWMGSRKSVRAQSHSCNDACMVELPIKQDDDFNFLMDAIRQLQLADDEWQWQERGDGSRALLILAHPWIAFFHSAMDGGGSMASHPQCESEHGLCSWLVRHLNQPQLRRLIAGAIHGSHIYNTADSASVVVSDATLRDDLMLAMTHAGYSVSFEKEQQLGGQAQWRIFLADGISTSSPPSPPSAWTLRPATDVMHESYSGRVWCVNVNHVDHLIIAQRAQRHVKSGEIIKAARPAIVGNCFQTHAKLPRRRKPILQHGRFNYIPTRCRYIVESQECPQGVHCRFSHVTEEVIYHASKFKTQLCSHPLDKEGRCSGYGAHCAKAHGQSDLRQPLFESTDENTARSTASASEFFDYVCPPAQREIERKYFMYVYKTKRCAGFPFDCSCDGLDWHDERERRRGPVLHYMPMACPNVRPYLNAEWGKPNIDCSGKHKPKIMKNGQLVPQESDEWECDYAHTLLELMYHPQVYKTGLCDHFNEEDPSTWKCVWKRRCAHSHGRDDVRTKEEATDDWTAHIVATTPPGAQLNTMLNRLLSAGAAALETLSASKGRAALSPSQTQQRRSLPTLSRESSQSSMTSMSSRSTVGSSARVPHLAFQNHAQSIVQQQAGYSQSASEAASPRTHSQPLTPQQPRAPLLLPSAGASIPSHAHAAAQSSPRTLGSGSGASGGRSSGELRGPLSLAMGGLGFSSPQEAELWCPSPKTLTHQSAHASPMAHSRAVAHFQFDKSSQSDVPHSTTVSAATAAAAWARAEQAEHEANARRPFQSGNVMGLRGHSRHASLLFLESRPNSLPSAAHVAAHLQGADNGPSSAPPASAFSPSPDNPLTASTVRTLLASPTEEERFDVKRGTRASASASASASATITPTTAIPSILIQQLHDRLMCMHGTSTSTPHVLDTPISTLCCGAAICRSCIPAYLERSKKLLDDARRKESDDAERKSFDATSPTSCRPSPAPIHAVALCTCGHAMSREEAEKLQHLPTNQTIDAVMKWMQDMEMEKMMTSNVKQHDDTETTPSPCPP